MPAAVRTGDVTTHGGTVAGPGSPTVFIGGAPATVVGDSHVCPISPRSGHLPVSVFMKGSATVFIGGKPAIRTSDSCACGAMAVVGCPTVFIG